MRQHCTDGSFRFCRWRAHTEALSEDSGPEALSTQGQYFALHVFYAILKHSASKLSANCCRTITMTRYTNDAFAAQCRAGALAQGALAATARPLPAPPRPGRGASPLTDSRTTYVPTGVNRLVAQFGHDSVTLSKASTSLYVYPSKVFIPSLAVYSIASKLLWKLDIFC